MKKNVFNVDYYPRRKDCKNKECIVICLKCGKCGRKFECGKLVKEAE